ncbi:uncharacterized protein LOC135462140 [Liolophura sinensis]|uniref:uncharacterized protein LOC135462140 n=1 Tax=Liolophura sinensis TaxID=3198878 RepID=UPI003158CBD6
MEGKEREDEDEKQSQHQVLVQPLHNLSDLKEEKLNALLKKTGSVEVTFLGHRYEEKKGFIKLQLNKTDFDNVITTSMVELSNDRALSAEQMPEIVPGVQNPVLQKMTEEATGEELELASVFVNNIPSDTRPGIMKMLFPAARNIQFPTLKDGKSQGYAILEVSKKFADAFVKHHEVYRPVIGGKVLKLHVISNQGQKPDTDEVIENWR